MFIFLLLAVYAENVGVLGELFLTLGSLAVRNEFCEEVLSLGGIQFILKAFENNISDKVCKIDFCISSTVSVVGKVAGRPYSADD